MSIANGDVVRVNVQGQYPSGNSIQNTFHMQLISGGPVAEATALTNIIAILEALYAIIGALLDASWIIVQVTGTNVTQDTDVGVGLFADDTPGTSVSTQYPPQIALGITLATARLRVRGRKFFGPLSDTVAGDDGVLVSSVILDMADVGDYMSASHNEAGTTFVFGVVASSDGVFLPFTSYAIPLTVQTQRRRRLGVGS